MPTHATSGPRRRGRRGGPSARQHPRRDHAFGPRQVGGRRPGRPTTRAPARSRSSWPPPGCATPTTTSPPATSRSRTTRVLGGHEGAGVVTAVGPQHQGLRGGRPRRLLVPARAAAVPLVRQRPCSTSATSAPDLLVGARFDDRDELPVHHLRRRGRRPDVRPRHVRRGHHGRRRVRGQDRRRHPARGRLPRRLRRRHRLGHRRQGRRGPSPARRSSSWASAASASTPSRARRTPAPATSSPSTRSPSSARRRMDLGATQTFATIEEAAEFARASPTARAPTRRSSPSASLKGEHVAQAFDGDRQGRAPSSSPASATSTEVGIPISLGS